MEVEAAGIKFTGGKMFAVITVLATLVGSLYGAFEVYKDYQDMKAAISSYSSPDLSGIEKQVALAEQRANEAVEYTRDIKTSLRSDLIAVEKSQRELEKDTREVVRTAQVWFDDRTANVDERLRDLETRMDKKIRDAIQNPLGE